jgi:PAS domain S-box-containing protein
LGQDTSQVLHTIVAQQKRRAKGSNVKELLTLQQELLRTQLFTLTHDAVILCNHEQRIIACNPTAEQLYGWSEQDAKGHNPHTLLQSRVYIEKEAEKEAENRPPPSLPSNEDYWEGKLVQSCQNGTAMVVKCRQSRLHNGHGEHIATLIICQDISAQQQMERALETQLQQTAIAQGIGLSTGEVASDRRIFEANLIGMSVSDTYGNIFEANDALLSLIGYTHEDIQNGLNWRQITPPEYREIGEQAIEEIYQNGISRPCEKEYVRKDGTRVPVLFVGALIDHHTDTYTSLIIDITSQKELERQRETFMSIIGHELRTPLTAINGSLQLAQRRIQRFMQGAPTLSTETEMLLNKQLKLVDQSLRQARVQNRLINDMLDISRLAIDKLELSFQPYNLIDIVREAVDDLRYTENYHTIELNLPPQDNIQVLADSDRIGQVISNYISNALKYSPPDGSIQVRIEPGENDVRVSVHDRGPGLSEETQKHIWDRYYRANGSGSKEQKKQGVNLGLGLYICQVLIKRHHGQVGVISTEGEGSTFWFSLPLLQKTGK